MVFHNHSEPDPAAARAAWAKALEISRPVDAALPEGKVLPCPFPWWDKQETHQVVRSDLAKLGVWLEEKQPVLDDYERAIGGEPPTRIVAVWLIAVSIFQKRKGICSFARIKLKSDKGEIFVGP